MKNQETAKQADNDLVDGKYSITDLVDMEHLRVIFEKFTRSTGFTIGFLDHPGLNILITTGWKDICVKFHRICPASLENCRLSNEHLLGQLKKPGQLVIESCENGLVDCATPIIIKGKHIASLATGQILLKHPDIKRFKKQAKAFGYDEQKYLEALKDVKVVSREKLKDVTSFLGELAAVVSELGYTNLKIKEETTQLEKEIVERKKAEEELEKYRRHLEELAHERTVELDTTNKELQREIVEHKNIEKELTKAGDYLDKIINSVADPVFVKDRKHRWVLLNNTLCSFMGYKREELIGKSDYDFFPKEEADVFWEKDETVFITGMENTNEEKFTDSKGITHIIVTKKVLYRNNDGQEFIVGIIRDISERKKTEDEINRLNAELGNTIVKLAAANKELDAFSYSVSHDLKAPLRALEGFSRIVIEDCAAKLDAKGKHALDVIGANARRMEQLIDDLLNFAHLGRREIAVRNLDMYELAQSISDELKRTIPQGRDVRLDVKRLPSVSADSAMMRQVWLNLLSNAIKFTGPKKIAHIEAGNSSTEKEEIFYVKDNGVGFDMEYIDKLFNVFQRLHGKSEFEGTGVGLAIVQRIINKHGGKVWAEAKVNKGATFYFSLPKGGWDGKQ